MLGNVLRPQGNGRTGGELLHLRQIRRGHCDGYLAGRGLRRQTGQEISQQGLISSQAAVHLPVTSYQFL